MPLNHGAGAQSNSIPVGAIVTMAAPSIPAGFLECNGATVKRADYPALFSLIGTTYGAGDSSTTFLLPDLRGEFIRGWDNGRTIDNGRAFGVFQDRDSSAVTSAGHTHNPGAGGGTGGSSTVSVTVPLANRPRNIAMYYIIKF
jgi:microcystin-dependent protein